MTCTQPITLYLRGKYPAYIRTEEELKKLNKPKFYKFDNSIEIKVPCGKCDACRLDKSSEWGTRCWAESQNWSENSFVTLTYNSGKRIAKRTGGNKYTNNLPITDNGKLTLFKKDVTNFLKRLRKTEKGGDTWINPITNKIEKPIRFLVCGEYGPKNGRPHYHIILFNYKPDDLKFYKYNHQKQPIYKSKKLQKIWGHGFVTVGNLTYKSACYVARYTMKKNGLAKKRYKKITINENGILKTKRTQIKNNYTPEPEFINMSRMPGIGLQYFNTNFEKILRNNGILIEKQLKKIPRYFKKKWEEKDWEQYHRWRYKNIKIGKINFEKILNETFKEELFMQQKEILFKKRIQEKLDFIKTNNILSRDNVAQNTC